MVVKRRDSGSLLCWLSLEGLAKAEEPAGLDELNIWNGYIALISNRYGRLNFIRYIRGIIARSIWKNRKQTEELRICGINQLG